MVEATKEMGGFSAGTEEANPSFSSPTVPRVVGQALGKIVHIIRGQAIQCQDTDAETAINNFDRLLTSEWPDRISRASHQTLNERQQKRDDAIQSTEYLLKQSFDVQRTSKDSPTTSKVRWIRPHTVFEQCLLVAV